MRPGPHRRRVAHRTRALTSLIAAGLALAHFACASASTAPGPAPAAPSEPEIRAAAETLATLARTPGSNVSEGEGGVVLMAYTVEWQERVEWPPVGADPTWDIRGPRIVREPVRVGPHPWLLRLADVTSVEPVSFLLGGARVEISLSREPGLLQVVQPDAESARGLAWAIDVLRRAKQHEPASHEPASVESAPDASAPVLRRAPVLEPLPPPIAR